MQDSGRKENVILTGLERMSRNRCLTGSFGIDLGEALDVEAMRRAAQDLVGTHDLKRFVAIRR